MVRPAKNTKEVKAPKVKEKRYGVILKINDGELFGHGDTIEEALMEAQPTEFQTFCEIVAVDNETKKEATAVYNVPRMKAFYGNSVTKDLVCEYLLTQMKE